MLKGEGKGRIWARERACGAPHTLSRAPKFPLPLSTPATQAIPDRTSVRTQERLRRRDFYDGAKLRRADLESGASNIGEVLYHTLMRCEHLVTLKRNKKKLSGGYRNVVCSANTRTRFEKSTLTLEFDKLNAAGNCRMLNAKL